MTNAVLPRLMLRMKEIPLPQFLTPQEPPPLKIVNADGGSDYVLICEHAGRRIPAALEDLGLPASELRRHIAYDLGAGDLAGALSRRMDAPLFTQRYSRLVCDCNRQPGVASFIPEISELTLIPGNQNLSGAERRRRREEIFQPFHQGVSAALDARAAAGRRSILVTIHSFTPVFKGVPRPWEIGVLYNRDRGLSPALLDVLREMTSYQVGDNQPYAVSDETDYAIPVHGEARGLDCVEIEIRNDLLADLDAVRAWAKLLHNALDRAVARR